MGVTVELFQRNATLAETQNPGQWSGFFLARPHSLMRLTAFESRYFSFATNFVRLDF